MGACGNGRSCEEQPLNRHSKSDKGGKFCPDEKTQRNSYRI